MDRLELRRNRAVLLVFGLLAPAYLALAMLNGALGDWVSVGLNLLAAGVVGGGMLWLSTVPLVGVDEGQLKVFKNALRPRSVDLQAVQGVASEGKRTFLLLTSGEKIEVPVAMAARSEQERWLSALDAILADRSNAGMGA